jgi:hypothetical protein
MWSVTSEEMLEYLRKICAEVVELNRKLDVILENLKKSSGLSGPRLVQVADSEPLLDVPTLLTLTDHLRKTAMVMLELRKASAEMVAEKTGRRRATESDCLNQLVRMGYLKKERKGLDVLFYVDEYIGDVT